MSRSNRRLLSRLLLLITILLRPTAAAAQGDPAVQVPPEGAVQEVVLIDGSRLYGRVEQTGDPIRFRLLSGDVIELRRERIRSLRIAEGRLEDPCSWSGWRRNSRSTRRGA